MDGTGSFFQGQVALAQWRDLSREVARERQVDLAPLGRPRRSWVSEARHALGRILRDLDSWRVRDGSRHGRGPERAVDFESGL